MPPWLEDAEHGLTDRFRALLHGLWDELLRLDRRLEGLAADIEAICDTQPDAKRLRPLRGVGPLIATARVARFGDGTQFNRERPAAASVGLTPRHHGTGGKARLLRFTKQGDRYLRSIADPRRPRRPQPGETPRRSPEPLGHCARPTHSHECGGGGDRQQDRAHGLGDVEKHYGL